MSTSNEREGRVIRTGGEGQIGPWKDGQALTLELTIAGTRVARVVATANNPNLRSYNPWEEIWGTSSELAAAIARLHDGDRDALSMYVDSKVFENDGAVDEYLRGYPIAARWAQTPPDPGWVSGSYAAAPGMVPYLFTTADPDLGPGGAQMALSLILNVNGSLAGVGWHKTFKPDQFNWKRAPDPGTTLSWTFAGATTDTRSVLDTDWWYVWQMKPR